jgi:hypothetical protein
MTTTPAAPDEDFGLAGHLAAISRLHAEGLSNVEALAQPWPTAAPELAESSPVPVERLVTGQPPVPGTLAAAA